MLHRLSKKKFNVIYNYITVRRYIMCYSISSLLKILVTIFETRYMYYFDGWDDLNRIEMGSSLFW